MQAIKGMVMVLIESEDNNNYVITKKITYIKKFLDPIKPKPVNSLVDTKISKCSNCNPDKCCCLKLPCYYLPCDFGGNLNDPDYIRMIIKTGVIGIYPHFLENPRFFLLRPHGKNESNKEITKNNSDNDPCIFLGDTGCILPRELRPTDGLVYICGFRDFPAFAKLKTNDLYDAWEPYQKTLEPLYYECQENKYPL